MVRWGKCVLAREHFYRDYELRSSTDHKGYIDKNVITSVDILQFSIIRRVSLLLRVGFFFFIKNIIKDFKTILRHRVCWFKRSGSIIRMVRRLCLKWGMGTGRLTRKVWIFVKIREEAGRRTLTINDFLYYNRYYYPTALLSRQLFFSQTYQGKSLNIV